jgi:hypothetical protein
MADLVVLEDSTIMTMIHDQKFAQTIPCLFNKSVIFANNGGGCGACRRKREQRMREEMARIKSCLGALDVTKKNELKALLGAKKIRVTFTRPGGEVVQLTF